MRAKSEAIYKRGCEVIPGGVNSPVRSFKGLGIAPMIVESGAGDTIWDADGRSYIDYCCSWGALILGHADPEISASAIEQVKKGTTFGIATEVEVRMAEKIEKLVPSIEKVRLVSSGTEATMTAMRLARGFTGKSKIIKFTGHYHGHSDSLLVQAGSGASSLNPLATSLGVTSSVIQDTICFPFNDTEGLRSFFRTNSAASEVAAVILEPITGNMGVVLPKEGFLEMLREETRRLSALLIFDEVITGFRVGLTGVQGLYGIDPELTCLGKVMGGGFPAAAVGGKREILDCLAPLGQVYQAGTLSGSPVAVAAGLKTLERVEKKGFYEGLENKTCFLTREIEEAIRGKNICLQRKGSMFSLFFGVTQVTCKEDLKNLDLVQFGQFFRYLFERGIYIPPHSHEAWFVSSAHTESHLEYTASTIKSFILSL
jgi:glutamate-1-semialdehyde 2,1-aminomutase